MDFSVDSNRRVVLIENVPSDFYSRPESSFLAMLESDGLIEKSGSTITVSFESFYQLSNKEKIALGLPEECPLKIALKTNAAVLAPTFKIEYAFKTRSGMIAFGAEVKDELFISHKKQLYSLPGNSAQIISLIDKLNDVDFKNDRLKRTEILNELLLYMPEGMKTDDRLKEVEVHYAQNFTLTLTNDHQIEPSLLKDSSGAKLLYPEYDEKFRKDFSSSSVRNHYQISRNVFVFIPKRLRRNLEVVKKYQRKKKSERLGFFYNPSKIIEREIEEDNIEESDSNLFVETELYCSERIQKLGVWHPKNFDFEVGEKNDWVPDNAFPYWQDDQLFYFKHEDVEDLLHKIEEAESNCKSSIEYLGQEIRITDQLIDYLKHKSANRPDDDILEEVPEDSDVSTVDKLVPIIFDNIEGVAYRLQQRLVSNVEIYTPSDKYKYTLKPHQAVCLEWLQHSFKNGRCGVLLADDMGLGKTFEALSFLKWLQMEMMAGRESPGAYLIVGPTALLKNWQEEHDNTLEGNGLGQIVEAYGSSFRSIKRLGEIDAANRLSQAACALTTYETMKNNIEIFQKVKWKVLIFDEIQYIKSPSAFVTEMAKAIASDFTIGLTGTPVENSLQDLWCIGDAIWSGYFGTYKDFRDKFKTDDQEKLIELKDRLVKNNPPPFMLRRLKIDEVEGLPKKTEFVITEEMDDQQSRSYNNIIQHAQDAEIKTPFETVLSLRRASLGYFDEETTPEELIKSSARLRATLKILDEINGRGEKVLVFIENRMFQKLFMSIVTERYNLSSLPRLINGKTPTKVRQRYVNEFQSLPPGFDIMVVSPKAGGTGFTLVNANNVIHLERAWNPAIEDQCSDRVYRLNQTKDVNIYIPQAIHPYFKEKSFDCTLHQLLTNKRNISRSVIVPSTMTNADRANFASTVTGVNYSKDDCNNDFYSSKEWRELATQFKAQCGDDLKCSNPNCNRAYPDYDKNYFEVDHIKPRSKYPELALDIDNLQILCRDCNRKKGNK